tara:strand:- start:2227 stop:2331 length:105 start_codon:yes stop_codon:yes gene_type:complete
MVVLYANSTQELQKKEKNPPIPKKRGIFLIVFRG